VSIWIHNYSLDPTKELLWDSPSIPVTEAWDSHYGCASCERTTIHDVLGRNVTSVILFARCRLCETERTVNTLYLL
jgi:hypothetical protein